MIDTEGTVARLREQLAAIDDRRDPHEHAVVAYRLGLAHAESPTGDPQQNLGDALRCYDLALVGFDRVYEPVAHARVLNAAAAAMQSLGRVADAAQRFEEASHLLTGRDRDDELAACLNNLGLAHAGLGRSDDAQTAFRRAIETFSPNSDEGRRGKAAALVNNGMVLASLGTSDALAAAIGQYETAVDVVGGDDAPYHAALADHARGVAEMSLAQRLDARQLSDRAGHLRRAVRAFEESLEFFSRTGFPYQHSLAKHNLAKALSGFGGEKELLLALAAVEDAVSILDPRLHRTEWEHAFRTLEEIEGSLGAFHPGRSRRELFVVLLEQSAPDERVSLLTNRLTRLLALPPDARHSAMVELAKASVTAGDHGLEYIGRELAVLTELPNDHLEAALEARLDANRQLPPDRREDADRALDQAVGDALNGPQRVFVRDFLSSRGFERP